MDARYFRMLFRNVNDGMFHIFSLWDTYQKRKVSVAYISGASETISHTVSEDTRFINDNYDIDMLVIASLNLYYVEKIVEMIDSRNIKCIIMPYNSPNKRRKWMEHLEGQAQTDKIQISMSQKSRRFLQDPYAYCINKGVEEFLYLLGNGSAYKGQDTIEGNYFKPVDVELDERIEVSEGRMIPVYQAGYKILSNWVFNFGVYEGNRFPTIVMYYGTIQDDPVKDDIVMNVKPVSGIKPCSSRMREDKDLCGLACAHRGDYDCIRKHKRKGAEVYENGVLLLGNMVVRGHVEELYQRFAYVKEKVRFVGIPNCGAKANWDYRIMGFGKEHNYRYFVGAYNSLTSPECIYDLGGSSPYIRYSMTDEYYGLCGSGFSKERLPIDTQYKL